MALQPPDAIVMMWSFGLMGVAILGMAFKGNSDDPRDSLAYKLRKLLIMECRRVVCTDAYIRDPDFVVLPDEFPRPLKDGKVGVRPRQPGHWHIYKNQELRPGRLYLACHLGRHGSGIFLRFHHWVCIDVAGS